MGCVGKCGNVSACDVQGAKVREVTPYLLMQVTPYLLMPTQLTIHLLCLVSGERSTAGLAILEGCGKKCILIILMSQLDYLKTLEYFDIVC